MNASVPSTTSHKFNPRILAHWAASKERWEWKQKLESGFTLLKAVSYKKLLLHLGEYSEKNWSFKRQLTGYSKCWEKINSSGPRSHPGLWGSLSQCKSRQSLLRPLPRNRRWALPTPMDSQDIPELTVRCNLWRTLPKILQPSFPSLPSKPFQY